MKLSQLAGLWSKDRGFIRFLNEESAFRSETSPFGLSSSDRDPADLIRTKCSISSRRDLDTDKAAAAIFNREFRHPYMAWAAKNSRTQQATRTTF
ncbi:hypothetical protein ABCV69_004589 [Pseudomonas aeruginosa]|uniref:hypothetical protein n=1 Tax=Pseudomonas aeruginosa TaxID=287 RepID=UPI0005B347AD|nr:MULTISPECIES: hypothetical protein [Pseudomonadaceae]EKY4114524.1 hypothetical protein [Pseudomonas aeruginosa]ELJ2277927.1 hypothetical protein [Pseudomonas aeruginosa]ELQ8329504.1 hypothetical protein [Pseudomonas aeruginosa]EMA4492055.1 hypothetical protein [Pseudomonas aeruginosa]EMB2229536.1 hypothetical protein [Pseudomonas aeruginosa]